MDHNDSCYHFLQFKLGRASKSVNDVWEGLWIAIVSEIWKHRNKVYSKVAWLMFQKLVLLS